MANCLKIKNLVILINLEKPLFQCTLGDFKEVIAMVLKDSELESEGKMTSTPKHYVYGIAGIAKLFGCSIPTAQRIKDGGEIDDAISQIGGVIVVDAEYALDLLRLSKKHRSASLKKSKK